MHLLTSPIMVKGLTILLFGGGQCNVNQRPGNERHLDFFYSKFSDIIIYITWWYFYSLFSVGYTFIFFFKYKMSKL